jgi:malate permease and related proteins
VSGLALLLLGLVVGLVAQRYRLATADGARVFISWIVFVSLPALVFRSVRKLEFSASLLLSAVLLWVVFAIAAVVAVVLVRRALVSKSTAGAVALCCGLGNTAFVGLPMIQMLYGDAAVPTAVFVDQLGSFVALSVFAAPFAAGFSKGSFQVLDSVIRLLKFPPFVALGLALLLRSVSLPAFADEVFRRLGDMLAPMALAVVGARLSMRAAVSQWRALAFGLLYKLVVAPVMVLAALVFVFRSGGQELSVVVCQSAMAPMLTAAVLAEEFGFDAELASTVVGVGVAISLVTVPAWSLILS